MHRPCMSLYTHAFNFFVFGCCSGDPTMYEEFWRGIGDSASIFISGWQTMSYFSDLGGICWFVEPGFEREVRRLHRLVGNAMVDGYHVLVGTGSTQLFQAVLYALSPASDGTPMNVVSPAPYYSVRIDQEFIHQCWNCGLVSLRNWNCIISKKGTYFNFYNTLLCSCLLLIDWYNLADFEHAQSYPSVTNFLNSGLYRWGGDANTFDGDTCIELICSPNNPDGGIRRAVVKSKYSKAVYDFAYYWPQYTPITEAADHDIMLFTVSKCTGHAGTRLG